MNSQNMPRPSTSPNEPADQKKPGAMGEHPVAVGIGAIGTGAAVGAAGGAVAGPIGVVAGAAVGAVVGGLAGKAVGEAINPQEETEHWRNQHAHGPYAKSGMAYDEYAPAYRYGWESFGRLGKNGQQFESLEQDLGRGWDKAKGQSKLGWDQAKSATRDAWERVKTTAHTQPRSAT